MNAASTKATEAELQRADDIATARGIEFCIAAIARNSNGITATRRALTLDIARAIVDARNSARMPKAPPYGA